MEAHPCSCATVEGGQVSRWSNLLLLPQTSLHASLGWCVPDTNETGLLLETPVQADQPVRSAQLGRGRWRGLASGAAAVFSGVACGRCSCM